MDQNNSNVIGPKVTAVLILQFAFRANPAPVNEDDVFPQHFKDLPLLTQLVAPRFLYKVFNPDDNKAQHASSRL